MMLFGVQMHAYGLLLGIAIVVAYELIEKKLLSVKFPSENIGLLTGVLFVCATIGARAWHVLTDYKLYSDDFLAVFQIWNGGLSIFGAVLGSIFGIYLTKYIFKHAKNISVPLLLDAGVFGLPIAQAIGRIGNFINQELYGLPTENFLKISIDLEHRIPGYEQFEFYHPLFFYEMVFTSLFAFGLYYLDLKKKLRPIGSGKIFLTYGLYYSFIRFFLDFLRVDRSIIGSTGLGSNQLFLLGVIVVLGGVQISRAYYD